LALVAGVGPALLARFELAALRAANEFDRSAAFLFANDGEAVRWLAFEFRFDPADGKALR
jgi:hypothetical protein